MSACLRGRASGWTVRVVAAGALAMWSLGCRPTTTATEIPLAETPTETVSSGPSDGESSDEDVVVAAATLTASDSNALDPQAEDAAVETAAEPAVESPAEPVVLEEPHRVLILGDSFAATGIGALLEKKLDAHPRVECYRKGKSSSGLARPDFFDWPDQARRQLELREPDLVVVILGGNDGQALTRHDNGEGRRVAWDHEDWAEAYRERVDDFLADLSADGRKVLWLGLPTMGLRSLEEKLVLIRGIQEDAVEALGDQGMYLDTAPFVTNEQGDLLTQARVGSRNKLQNLRAKDRIHFTMAGSKLFADRVYPSVLEALGVDDVQPEP